MSKLQIVSGDFGRGKARYDAGVLNLPNREARAIEDVASVSADATVAQRDWLTILSGAAEGAAAGAAVGLVATPIGSAGAAAVGASIGAFANTRTRSLVRITFRDGRTAVGICEPGFPKRILA